jgi:hypothetical protein
VKISERPSLQEAAEIDEEDVFKEIEILKSLDQCAPPRLVCIYAAASAAQQRMCYVRPWPRRSVHAR